MPGTVLGSESQNTTTDKAKKLKSLSRWYSHPSGGARPQGETMSVVLEGAGEVTWMKGQHVDEGTGRLLEKTGAGRESTAEVTFEE